MNYSANSRRQWNNKRADWLLSHLVNDMEKEIEEKRNLLHLDLESNGKERYFYVALHNEKIIGTIEYGPSSKLIHDLTHGALDMLFEIGTVYVHPNFQGHGVANLLLNAIFLTLQGKGISEFCLDCGYKNAQQIWRKKFGEPTYLFPNYWNEGTDHMIWRKRVTGQPLRFIVT
ncbi:GNAT family N-acetyltransferase [Paenibacillus tyrfis]|uniref:GNAT family N-acetyltransferase n=1 Tax=Paenibacillus tyrfis TaxID=1501230 RepID=UPI00068EE165|nr:GNAT family N-acetyltransferase [Paenibacillus tyrfis]